MRHVAARKHLIRLRVSPKDFSDQGFWRKFFDAKTDSIGSYVIYSKNSKNKTQEPDLVKANPFGLKKYVG